jgi:Leucine-rich repeat (LRR) protein
LKKLSNLETLHLDENEITDISSLKNLVNLRVLNLQNNPITKQQIDELQEALPNCDIRC